MQNTYMISRNPQRSYGGNFLAAIALLCAMPSLRRVVGPSVGISAEPPKDDGIKGGFGGYLPGSVELTGHCPGKRALRRRRHI